MPTERPSISEAEKVALKTAYLIDSPGLRYEQALALQNALFARKIKDKNMPDVLILTEHPAVYTFGKSGREENLLLPEQDIRARGIELYWTDRGGDITFHGPGQLVGYPIFDLHNHYLDVGRFLREIEQALIDALAVFGIQGSRNAAGTGVWVGEAKIAAIGIKLSRWVTKHGFALNITTDLTYFENIIPCGISDKAVTTMARECGRIPERAEVVAQVVAAFSALFSLKFQAIGAEKILQTLQHESG